MSSAHFHRAQSLNEWSDMLYAIYGRTSNYSKSSFEIYTHLVEVVGVFGKLAFKKGDKADAVGFLPKIFAWGMALHRSVPGTPDIEQIVLRKFPAACPYCHAKPCKCWSGVKPSINGEGLRQLYYRNAANQSRTLNDFQLMLRQIYGHTWPLKPYSEPAHRRINLEFMYIRLTEELGEIAETIRFHSLYPENFQNELADFFAWWVALATSILESLNPEAATLEELLWPAYPGYCVECQMLPCHCRPGPVRELMSRPPPGFEHRSDGLTLLLNQTAYNEDVGAIKNGNLSVTVPFACCRFDVDDFKNVNDTYGHSAGDVALKHIASIIRKKAGERSRAYRISGDEFGLLLMDRTEEEAAGLARRICEALKREQVRWVDATGDAKTFIVSASGGVAQCEEAASIERAFEAADKASYQSKRLGKGRVTRASELNSTETAL